MILASASAAEVGAEEIPSEDFNEGQAIAGIKIVNPLKVGHMGSEVHDSRQATGLEPPGHLIAQRVP